MTDAWYRLPVLLQDALATLALLLPLLVVGAILLRGFAPGPLVRAMLWRFRWTNLVFVALITVSVGIGIGLLAQERGLRAGTAAAADKFDIVIAAPGSDVTMMLATIYLQPSDAPLLGAGTYAEIAAEPGLRLAAPLAFGDSVDGHPIVGTTGAFVDHLADGALDGRLFATPDEAVVGADAGYAIGDRLEPAHGVGAVVEEHAHEGVEVEVVGRMPRLGNPWDRAVIVPIEGVWETHGLGLPAVGGAARRLGPPFAPDAFFGTPAIVVSSESLAGAYALRSRYQNRADTMAFFPGTVLSQLFVILGDVRQVMSLLALVTQALVAVSVIVGLIILMRLFQRNMALLRALGAPVRFVCATIWCYAATLLVTGAVAGLVFGAVAAMGLSRILSARTGIAIAAAPGWPEIHLAAAFTGASAVLALLPAVALLSRPIVESLRS